MGTEIEKKYLISANGEEYATSTLGCLFGQVAELERRVLKTGDIYHQGYLPKEKWTDAIHYFGVDLDFTPVEVRVRQKGSIDPAYEFTIKGDGTLSRNEIPLDIDAKGFMRYWGDTLGSRLEKSRLTLPANDGKIEFDVYRDRDLFVAEIEFANLVLANQFEPLGLDVTADKAYKNKNLAR